MRFLYPMLRDRSIDGVRQSSFIVAATVFSTVNVLALKQAQLQGLWSLAVAVVLSVLSLALVTSVVQRLFLTIWAYPVLGSWVYESSSGNWGLARIGLRGGELDYSVQLYRTEADVMAAARNEPGFAAKCFATVTSVGVTYDRGQVELIYKVGLSQGDYQPRSGMLTLSPLSPGEMKGYWKSDILGDEPNRGTLDLYRPNRRGN